MKSIPNHSSKISNSRLEYSFKKGMAHESLFKERCQEMGWNVVKTSVYLDKKHIDFFVNGKGVDVKTSRNLNSIWLEYTNRFGYKGWLFSNVDILAFFVESEKSFYCFSRVDLLNYVKKNVLEKTSSNLDYNKLYCRGDKYEQKDQIIKVRYTDIKYIKHKIL